MGKETNESMSIAEELSLAKQRNQELREELELARIENDNRRMVYEIDRLNREYTPESMTITYGYGGIPCNNATLNPY